MAQSQEEVQQEKRSWHWRNTMRPARFFSLDARAAIPFFVLLFYFRIITLVMTIIITVIFSLLERKGLTFPAALRSFRCWLTGQRRPGWYWMRKRKIVDYG